MKKITFYLTAVLCVMVCLSASAQLSELADPNMDVAPFNTDAVVVNTSTIGNGQEGGLLYDNGPHFNVAGSPNLSVLEDLALGMNTLGNNCNIGQGFSIADDFTLANESDITSMDFYQYQTNAPNTSTISELYVRIYDGDPALGGSIIFGDFTTNLLDSTVWSDTYRESESNPGTARAIHVTTVAIPTWNLAAGTYWVEWTVAGDAAFSGPWQPPISILGQAATGDAQIFDGAVWAPLTDSGTGDPMGSPFQIYGTEILSVDDNALSTLVSLYPNPANKDVTLVNASNVDLQKAEIYNVLGKLVQTIDLSNMNSERTFDVSGLANGLYMMQISSDRGSITKKLVKR